MTSMGNSGTPRTRQSPLALAAFRPWGSSQDGRRAGSNASVVPIPGVSVSDHTNLGYHGRRRIRLVAYGARLERGLG